MRRPRARQGEYGVGRMLCVREGAYGGCELVMYECGDERKCGDGGEAGVDVPHRGLGISLPIPFAPSLSSVRPPPVACCFFPLLSTGTSIRESPAYRRGRTRAQERVSPHPAQHRGDACTLQRRLFPTLAGVFSGSRRRCHGLLSSSSCTRFLERPI